jgi:hypothetical protein
VDGHHPVAVDQTTAVLMSRITHMPGLMAFGMKLLLVVFDWYGLLRGGKRFRYCEGDKRLARIQEWANAPIGPCRDMVEFHRKMGAFVALSIEAGEQP